MFMKTIKLIAIIFKILKKSIESTRIRVKRIKEFKKLENELLNEMILKR